jgi:hypothetical protein
MAENQNFLITFDYGLQNEMLRKLARLRADTMSERDVMADRHDFHSRYLFLICTECSDFLSTLYSPLKNYSNDSRSGNV